MQYSKFSASLIVLVTVLAVAYFIAAYLPLGKDGRSLLGATMPPEWQEVIDILKKIYGIEPREPEPQEPRTTTTTTTTTCTSGTIPGPASDAPCSGEWQSFQNFAGTSSGNPIIENFDRRLIVAVKGADAKVYAKEWNISSQSVLKDWYVIIGDGPTAEDLKFYKNSTDLTIYSKGADGIVYYAVYKSLGTWTAWEKTGICNQNFGNSGPSSAIGSDGYPYKVNATTSGPVNVYKCTDKTKGALLGRVWIDSNENQTYDSDELLIQDSIGECKGNFYNLTGVSISWTGPETGNTRINKCNPEPYYSASLKEGTYNVSISLPQSWKSTTDSKVSVAIKSGQNTHHWFGIKQIYQALEFTSTPGTITIPAGNGTKTMVKVKTLNSSISDQNITLKIFGIDENWFGIDPVTRSNVPYNTTVNFSINFSVPQNTEAQDVKGMFEANSEYQTIQKNFTLKVLSNYTNKTIQELFNVSSFSCLSRGGGYACSVNFTYTGNENMTLVFTLVSSDNVTVNTTPLKITKELTSVSQSYFCANLGAGNYYLSSWKIYKSSDSDFLSALMWSTSKERKFLAC